ncbi:MAG TPA: hypothetical protein PLC65_07335 [Bacteroidia bacterium]|nr:hypothetical protein [Bacteroidia bacterium]HRD38427.1 hypothetical protein [Bacteroidia bacterium]
MKTMSLPKQIQLTHSKVWMREDGIVVLEFGDHIELDVKEAKELLQATKEISGGKKVLILNVAGKQTTATSAARDFAASPEAVEYTLAEAYVVNNLPQKIIANFYINFHKPLVPTKIFNNTEAAILWLKSLDL